MEPSAKGRRRSSDEVFASINRRLFIAWLRSARGAEMKKALESELAPSLEAMLFTTEEGRAMQEKVIERNGGEQRVVVDCEPLADGKWFLRVFGSPVVKVAIVQRPMVPPNAECEILAEQSVVLDLPKTYQRCFHNLRLRQTELIEAIDVMKYCERYQAQQADKAIHAALKVRKK